MAREAANGRAARKGPLITLTCECGQRKQLRYGERWTCEGCGRTFDTNKIPFEQYAEVRRAQLRFRRIPLAISVVSLACLIAFTIAGRPLGGLILVGFCGTAWSMFARPLHKRKYREALAKLPSWEIEPD
jgi:hypothetical protein